MYEPHPDHTEVTPTQEALLPALSDTTANPDDAGLMLQELLEQAGASLGGNLWDVDGIVFEVRVSRGLCSLHIREAWCDAINCYHGLSCQRCGEDVSHPVTLPGHGYVLGPFHSECAKEAEVEFRKHVTATLGHVEVAP